MKRSIDFLVAYLLYWLSYFFFFRIIFLIYHKSLSAELNSNLIGGILWKGLQSDLLFSAGLCLFPALLLLAAGSRSTKTQPQTNPSAYFIHYGLKIYTSICLIFFSILCAADLELFRIWGYRMDASPLLYLNTPTEMLSSMGSSPLWTLSLLNIMVNLYFGLLYARLLHPYSARILHGGRQLLPASLFSFASLLLMFPVWEKSSPISLKPTSSYFSTTLFANQATVNIPWNFFYALGNDHHRGHNPYEYLQAPLADSLFNDLYSQHPETPETEKRLNTRQPNVVLIIWESFTAKVSRHTGSLQHITPQFDQLAEEGLLFTNLYASGDRSDKGLLALLSGYPAQPGSSLLATAPQKAASLPHLSQAFNKAGYHSAFYYGGSLSFANLAQYLQHAHYQELISGEDFEAENAGPRGRWGAHDEVVLEKLFEDIQGWDTVKSEKQAFFKTVFTLSSHEPFDIPVKARFGEKSSTAQYLSALHYTDSMIGRFIEKAKKEAWYENTLFIIVADHGHTYPGNSRGYEREKFHIPMLWLGGALAGPPAQIRKTMSQTDLPASLLHQLGLPAEAFPWSKDIFNPSQAGFAHYFFHDGVGLLSDSSYISFDNTGKRLIEHDASGGQHPEIELEQELDYARTYLQKSYADFLNR